MNVKKLLYLLILATLPVAALAQGHKIGIVDGDVVIQKSVKGKAFFDEYQSLAAAKQDEIKAKIDNFRAQEKDFQAKAASLSEDKNREMQVQLQEMQTDIKRLQEDAKRAMDLKLNTGLQKFQKELAPLIRQVALEKSLDLVMNNGPNSNIVFISEAIDITDAVIKKYDEAAK